MKHGFIPGPISAVFSETPQPTSTAPTSTAPTSTAPTTTALPPATIPPTSDAGVLPIPPPELPSPELPATGQDIHRSNLVAGVVLAGGFGLILVSRAGVTPRRDRTRRRSA